MSSAKGRLFSLGLNELTFHLDNGIDFAQASMS